MRKDLFRRGAKNKGTHRGGRPGERWLRTGQFPPPPPLLLSNSIPSLRSLQISVLASLLPSHCHDGACHLSTLHLVLGCFLPNTEVLALIAESVLSDRSGFSLIQRPTPLGYVGVGHLALLWPRVPTPEFGVFLVPGSAERPNFTTGWQPPCAGLRRAVHYSPQV
jgi:hypothetical protein